MSGKTELRATAAPWHSGVELMLRHDKAVAVSVKMETVDPGVIVEPFLRLKSDEAQTLMDDLWHAGIRPTEGSGSAGSLAATERHLADMRAIAFKHLELEAEQ